VAAGGAAGARDSQHRIGAQIGILPRARRGGKNAVMAYVAAKLRKRE
jgi:hypothetical protein